MILVLWTTGVDPTGTLYGLPLVNTLNETNHFHLSVERIHQKMEKEKKKNAPRVLDTLVAWSSGSGSDTVVTGDFGSAAEGKQTTAK